MKNGFIVAGTNSGCGKTTITIGLMRYFSRKGYKVAPFKVGPDYIDPLFIVLQADNIPIISTSIPAQRVCSVSF
jgi:cobyrinic acid a,c-diamide synthase